MWKARSGWNNGTWNKRAHKRNNSVITFLTYQSEYAYPKIVTTMWPAAFTVANVNWFSAYFRT